MHRNLASTVLLTISLFSFTLSAPSALAGSPASEDWKAYWYGGLAELNRYELKQSRYGEVREGDAVMIFVTEDFLPKTQVKFEGRPAPDQPISILKLNATRKFLTGVYPYSTMTSVFTPATPAAGPAYKVTTSSQEWCGHVFMQLNRRSNAYSGRYYSYFQGEGDQTFDLPDALLEDEVFTRIRVNPASLPVGSIKVIPGTLFLRLMHREVDAYDAEATLEESGDESLSPKSLQTYRIRYGNLNRSLAVTFEKDFPHSILAWEESHAPLGGRPGTETTRAVRTHSIKLDYWNKNHNADLPYRKQLGLN